MQSLDKTGIPKISTLSLKERSKSQKRIIKLERISFEIQAQKLRKENNNRHVLNDMKEKKKSKSYKKMLTEIKEENVGKFLEPTRIIAVSAQRWVIYDYYSSKYVRGYRARDSYQLGTFSKLLVFCVVNTLIKKYEIDIDRFQTIAIEPVLKLFSHKSLLKTEDIISLQDLLHLMIMQESQVYEIILAVNMGSFIEKKRKKTYYSVYDTGSKNMKDYLKEFYELVNSYCKLLNLQTIKYIQSNPEKRKENNKCTAADIGILSIQCLKIPLFMDIIKKLDHNVKVQFINNQGNLTSKNIVIVNKSILNKFIPYRNICRNWWQKDNFMNSHCSLLIQYKNTKLKPIVVVLLACYGPNDREKDIQQISEWYLKNGFKQVETLVNSQLIIQNINNEQIVTLLNAQKKQSIKLPTLNNNISDIYEKTISFKLRLKDDSVVETRYDKLIKSKILGKQSRLKTQV